MTKNQPKKEVAEPLILGNRIQVVFALAVPTAPIKSAAVNVAGQTALEINRMQVPTVWTLENGKILEVPNVVIENTYSLEALRESLHKRIDNLIEETRKYTLALKESKEVKPK